MEPAGIILPYAGSTAPEGYLMCDGSAVSRSTYAALFAAIGTTYGAGDDSTTFNIPDLTGRVAIGVSGTHALGATGGEESHALLETELPVHHHEVPQHGHGNDIVATTPTLTHTITQPAFNYAKPESSTKMSADPYSGTANYNGTANAAATRSTKAAVGNHAAANCTKTGAVSACQAFDTTSAGSGTAHNNMQPYMAFNYIISV